MDTSADSVWTSHSTAQSERVLWEIGDLQRRLQETDMLLSDAFSFGDRQWRLLLDTDSTHFEASLSRFDATGKASLFPIAWWHAGVVDRDGAWHYDRSGYFRMDPPSQDWITVAEWTGPEWNHLLLEKDKFLPGGRMTVAVQLWWGSAVEVSKLANIEVTSLVDSSPSNIPLFGDVTITVENRTFRVRKSMLEAFTPTLADMLHPIGADGKNLVVHLSDCDAKTFEIVLAFLYTGSLDDIDPESLTEAYKLADQYHVAGLKEECVRQLLAELSVGTVCGVLAFADVQGDEELRKGGTEYFLQHAAEVFRHSTWSWLEANFPKLASDLRDLKRQEILEDTGMTSPESCDCECAE